MVNQKEDRWIPWIGVPEYRERLTVLEKHIRELSTKYPQTTMYTPHDATHCLAVEKMVKALISKGAPKLTDLEKFILFAAVWMHDLGMLQNVWDEFCKDKNIPGNKRSLQGLRDRHVDTSAWYLSSHYGEILKIDFDGNIPLDPTVDSVLRNYAFSVNLISQFHRITEDINDCPQEKFIKGVIIRTRLLACLLRLGDTLHIDSSRFNRLLYDMLQMGSLDRSARLHWLKSYVVSDIYLDSKNEVVIVNIDLPTSVKPSLDNKSVFDEDTKNLEEAITNDIYTDVIVVRETFKDNGLPAYATVKANITFVPGYQEKDIEEIKGVISDLDIQFAPSSSKVITSALNSISALCNITFQQWRDFDNQMAQLILFLKDVLDRRPSHVGLGKVIERIDTIFREFTNNLPSDKNQITTENTKDCQVLIDKVQNLMRNERNRYAGELDHKCTQDLFNNIQHIILFGYSEMVARFLHEYGEVHTSWKGNLKLYVLEGSGKRRLIRNNNLEYNDGLHYAIQLARHGFKNIELLPDTSFGSFAYLLKTNHEIQNSLVLFGVNGIDEKTKDCGHTSGHLMIAIVAKYFGIPIKVIADSFKMGPIQWNAEKSRDTAWLTGDKDILRQIGRYNIELKNYRQDRIPLDLINEIIKDGQNITGGAILNMGRKQAQTIKRSPSVSLKGDNR